MGYEYFIAQRTFKSIVKGKKVSRPIIRISVISIVLALVVNLITLAVVNGFQQEVRRKVSGFGSHILVLNAGERSIHESEPLRIEQDFLKKWSTDPLIRSIQPVAYKPVLFQSDRQKIKYKLASGKDTTEWQQNVSGALIKGVQANYDFSFFKEHLIEGEIPNFRHKEATNHVLISSKLARDLNYEVGQEVNAFFIRKSPVKRKFKIAGIYETGLEEFDKRTVIGNLNMIQELNDWGIHASITLEDTLHLGHLIVKAELTGGNGNYRCDWGRGFEKYTRFALCPSRDTTIRLVASDYWGDIRVPLSETTLSDTAYLKLDLIGSAESDCSYEMNKKGELQKSFLDDAGYTFRLKNAMNELEVTTVPGRGSSSAYVSGFEINIRNWEQLTEVTTELKKSIEFIPTRFGEILQVKSIKDTEEDIFVWLDFLDINVLIILVLMILIGIINMGSALLVLIIIRTRFIGILKALGATNWKIRKIFLIHAGRLILKGMLYGNLIGLAVCFVQDRFSVIYLNPEVYYLNKVPVDLSFSHWLLLNLGTLLICMIALLLPSVVITRIVPAKAIRFQ